MPTDSRPPSTTHQSGVDRRFEAKFMASLGAFLVALFAFWSVVQTGGGEPTAVAEGTTFQAASGGGQDISESADHSLGSFGGTTNPSSARSAQSADPASGSTGAGSSRSAFDATSTGPVGEPGVAPSADPDLPAGPAESPAPTTPDTPQEPQDAGPAIPDVPGAPAVPAVPSVESVSSTATGTVASPPFVGPFPPSSPSEAVLTVCGLLLLPGTLVGLGIGLGAGSAGVSAPDTSAVGQLIAQVCIPLIAPADSVPEV